MSYVKLPPSRVLDDSFFSCVPADYQLGQKKIVTPAVTETMAEALKGVMPKKPKGRTRRARMPLDAS